MKTATLRSAFMLGASAFAVVAFGAGSDNRHLLGAVDGGAGTTGAAGTAVIAGTTGTAGTTGAAGSTGGSIDAGTGPEVGVLGPSQSWTGYIENYKFRSGSDAVKITFASDAAGNLVGTVTLGSGTPPPPATDPNVGYPADLLSSVPDVTSARNYLAEGFGYSMRSGTVTGARLRFGVDTWEIWKGWCALQTPAPRQGPCNEAVCQTSCLPNWGSMSGPNGCGLLNPATNQYDPVDCGKLALCGFGSVCMCVVASGCSVREDGSPISFDLTITGDLASGSVAGLGDHNVHFTKDP